MWKVVIANACTGKMDAFIGSLKLQDLVEKKKKINNEVYNRGKQILIFLNENFPRANDSFL